MRENTPLRVTATEPDQRRYRHRSTYRPTPRANRADCRCCPATHGTWTSAHRETRWRAVVQPASSPPTRSRRPAPDRTPPDDRPADRRPAPHGPVPTAEYRRPRYRPDRAQDGAAAVPFGRPDHRAPAARAANVPARRGWRAPHDQATPQASAASADRPAAATAPPPDAGTTMRRAPCRYPRPAVS